MSGGILFAQSAVFHDGKKSQQADACVKDDMESDGTCSACILAVRGRGPDIVLVHVAGIIPKPMQLACSGRMGREIDIHIYIYLYIEREKRERNKKY